MIDRFARKQKWGPRGTGPHGRKLCYCGCGGELAEGQARRNSLPGCFEVWRTHSDAGYIRSKIFERDKGVCALCGVDAPKQQAEARDTGQLIRWLARRYTDELLSTGKLELFPGFTPGARRHAEYRKITEPDRRVNSHDAYDWATHYAEEEMKRRFGAVGAGHSWEADHIVPVVEGGGGCGLEGYRTLCIACHKKQTSLLAARRALSRKAK